MFDYILSNIDKCYYHLLKFNTNNIYFPLLLTLIIGFAVIVIHLSFLNLSKKQLKEINKEIAKELERLKKDKEAKELERLKKAKKEENKILDQTKVIIFCFNDNGTLIQIFEDNPSHYLLDHKIYYICKPLTQKEIKILHKDLFIETPKITFKDITINTKHGFYVIGSIVMNIERFEGIYCYGKKTAGGVWCYKTLDLVQYQMNKNLNSLLDSSILEDTMLDLREKYNKDNIILDIKEKGNFYECLVNWTKIIKYYIEDSIEDRTKNGIKDKPLLTLIVRGRFNVSTNTVEGDISIVDEVKTDIVGTFEEIITNWSFIFLDSYL